MKSNTKIVILFVALMGTATVALGQIRLISGSPVPSSSSEFAARLFEVAGDGSVQSVADLVPWKTGINWGGVNWVSVLHEAGLAVLISNRLLVVDLQRGSIVKTCAPPSGPPHSVWNNEWLLNTPSYGLLLALDFYNPEQRTSALVGWRVDPSFACEKSSVQLEPIELSHIEASGRFGIGDVGLSDGINHGVSVDADGNIMGRLGQPFPYGARVPPTHLANFKPAFAAILINNREIMALAAGGRTDPRVFVLRKRDETWRRVPLPAQRIADTTATRPLPGIRGFGHYIAIVEVQPKDAQNPESAGRSEWRKGANGMGPDVEFLLRGYKDVYPGRLHLYDVETERTYTISTRQADSEILLVEHGTVYYRASDRLYSAPITENGIGSAKLLATDEVIRDAHWAYIKH